MCLYIWIYIHKLIITIKVVNNIIHPQKFPHTLLYSLLPAPFCPGFSTATVFSGNH